MSRSSTRTSSARRNELAGGVETSRALWLALAASCAYIERQLEFSAADGPDRIETMGGLSPWHLIILGLLALVLFSGRGKLSEIMGDAAKGIKAFKDGLK